jgi:flagellar hook-associated protein 2
MAEVTSSTYEPSYDYSSVGSVGSEAAQSVNGEMINKIRAAEEESTLTPIIEKIDALPLEAERLAEISDQIDEFVDLVDYFDLGNDENVFNQFLFDTSGTSAVFDAVDKSTLKEGTSTINITQLAQKDVYQGNIITDKTSNVDSGTLSIQIGTNDAITFDTSSGMSYEDLANEINLTDGLTASIEQVGDSSYRLIVKSSETGTSNALTISGLDLGFNDVGNHTLTAQNLNATIDGVAYDTSSNSITTQGSLKITAIETGTSTITISKDTSAVTVAAEQLVEQYNNLYETLTTEIYDDESVITNKDTLKTILQDVKNILFAQYGAETPTYGAITTDVTDSNYYTHANVTNNELSLFVLGFELEKDGSISLDEDKFSDIVNGVDENYNVENLKNVFTGSYENNGLGVQLKEYLDALDSYDGLFTQYETDIASKNIELEEEKEKEIERLDTKYSMMAEKFSAYSAIIAQMESAFAGLEMMIAQSTASS